MRRSLRMILFMSIVGTLAGWRLCMVPGRFDVFLFAMFLLTILGIFAFVVFGIPLGILYVLVNYYDIKDWYREFDRSKFREQFDRATVAVALAIPFVWFVFFFVAVTPIPNWVGFSFSQSEFETAAAEFEAIQALMASDAKGVRKYDKKLGIYHVDEVGIDGRGGIYFRVRVGGDGIGPDSTSYGFVKNPNPTGSPFGRKYYDPIHLTGDWYLFRASDDFY